MTELFEGGERNLFGFQRRVIGTFWNKEKKMEIKVFSG